MIRVIVFALCLNCIPEMHALLALNHPIQDEVFYFLLIDRFEDGNPDNNRGGYTGGRETTGYDPGADNFFHGGDLAGLQNRLDYLQTLGVTALWITPVMTNKPVQFSSAGYHGYWITDFLNVDPHLGTNEEFKALVEAVHARGMKLYLDIVVNHTADVIYFTENQYSYRDKSTFPFRDSGGMVFDDRDFAWDGNGDATFPELDINGSFPYTPTVNVEDVNRKNPGWLNDLTNYHNRGNTTFSGEDSLYGDFFGLDDLFTEKPEVVDGFIDVFTFWIREYKIDGFRVDTVKHVNREFWIPFGEALRAEAAKVGIDHFFLFGEIFDGDQRFTSEFSTEGSLDATLDFGLSFGLRDWVSRGLSSAGLYAYFDADDYHLDVDSNSRIRPIFLGNHDMGRWAHFIEVDNPGMSEDQRIDLVELGYASLFFLRGQPIIYYGDEQGFVGTGGDNAAREDMMPSQVATYNGIDLLGTTGTTADSNFDTTHPLFLSFKRMIQVYKAEAGLRQGLQVSRPTEREHLLAISRYDPNTGHEYIFVGNNDRDNPQTGKVMTFFTGGHHFEVIYETDSGGNQIGQMFELGEGGDLELTVDPLQAIVLKSTHARPRGGRALSVSIQIPLENGELVREPYSHAGHSFPGRVHLEALVNKANVPARVSFSYALGRAPEAWIPLGMDDNAPYQVYFHPPEMPDGETLFLRAVGEEL